MKASGPIPPGFEADADGRLTIGGWDAETLVNEAGGTPLFVYDTRRVADQISRFRAAFPGARIAVQGDDGQHFAAEVIDESFRGMNRVKQQRAVYAALKGHMGGELHALALETSAPSPKSSTTG